VFERILIPLDSSKTAELVLPYVIEIVSRFMKECENNNPRSSGIPKTQVVIPFIISSFIPAL